ncbi:hypothetical protein [Orientia tsutsugamushi]|uniref:hypothetical protein n=1 Tax=Orientia tsutsugamushi TaxID=784 RepID=UPI000D5A2AB2|nr:IS630 family transposase [Orientia tsutsugamushi]
MLKNNTDKTSKELASLYPRKIASSIILRTIKNFRYSYKKVFIIQKNNMLRNEFTKTIKIIPKDKIALIDESGIEDTAYRNYGGSRRYGEKAYQHTQRVSMI